MTYYKIKDSIQGLKTIFYAEFPDNYDYSTEDSVHNLKFHGKLEVHPNLSDIRLKNSFNPNKRDMLKLASTGQGGGIIISDKLLNIIKNSKLPTEYQVFDVNLIHKNKNYHFNYFYLFQPVQETHLDFSKISFFEGNIAGQFKRSLNINSYEEFKNIKKSNPKIHIYPEKIFFSKSNITTDIFSLTDIGLGYYISESLKEAILKEDCRGIDFSLVD